MTGEELAAVIRGIVPAIRELVAWQVREVSTRIRALELQGPARDGRDGQPGRDGVVGPVGEHGRDGIDGKDGVGFDDFEELYDGERTFTHRYHSGDRVKEFTWKVSMEIYRGTYREGKTYERGDGVTWGGSEWHCNEVTTTKPGENVQAWTLKVKQGRDGRDRGARP